MDNPITAVEHLPKNQKIIVVGGVLGLGGLLIYRSHQKNLAAAQANQGGPVNGNTDTGTGTANDGTQDPNAIGTSADPYAYSDGMIPAGGDPYGFMYGGMGTTDPGAYYGGTGAGDLMNPNSTGGGGGTTDTTNVSGDYIAGDQNNTLPPAGAITGGGAPKTNPNNHHASSTPRHKKAQKAVTVSHPGEGSKPKTTKPKPKPRKHR